MLSSLAIGLSSQNTQAIESWNTQRVVLNKNSNINMNQSVLTKEDLKNFKMTKKDAVVGELGIVAKAKGHQSVSAQFLGIKKDQFIYKDQDLVAGKKAKKTNEVTVDSSFKDQGYHLGDKISLNGSSKKYKIVALSITPRSILHQLFMVDLLRGRSCAWPLQM